MHKSSISHQIAQLTTSDEQEVARVALDVAHRAARSSQSARKSLALVRRHALAAGAKPVVIDLVMELARADLERLQNAALPAPAATPAIPWLSAEAAAHTLNVSPSAIKESLKTVEGRRKLGWPWWDGRWRIPEPAVNPMARASYMAELPLHEPRAHVATLPPWCEREEPEGAGV